MKDKQLPALSVALVEGDRTIWAKGFGLADPEKRVPATAATVYRIGSVSKLFTDIGIMQLVEKKEVDLDAPIQTILPDFRPRNPSGSPITLRELMSHRSGLVREPPVGHYFDGTSPSLAATVASLNETELVYAPGTHTKYSNAGVAVVGYALERKARVPFGKHLERAVLEPMGMASSAFEPSPTIRDRLAKAFLWGYDGRQFPAPTFELGMAPAGSLYSTVEDLGRFLSVLFAGGTGPRGRVLRRETLEEMWTPQLAARGAKEGFGLGFRVGKIEGRRSVGHDGAIYGFATSLEALPAEHLGAVAVTTVDSANAVTDRIVREALRLLLAAREGRPLPMPEATEPVPPEVSRGFEGSYGRDGRALVDLEARGGELTMLARAGGERKRLRKSGNGLVTDGRLDWGTRIGLRPEAIRVEDLPLSRVGTSKPEPPSP